MLTGTGQNWKVDFINLAKVSAFTAIQLTAETASKRERIAELRFPMDLWASTEVVSPVWQEMIPSSVATTMSIRFPSAQANTASFSGHFEPYRSACDKVGQRDGISGQNHQNTSQLFSRTWGYRFKCVLDLAVCAL